MLPINTEFVVPGDATHNDSIIPTYGYKQVTITDAETNWDQLAQNYLGDSSLSYILASYNNLPEDTPMKAGLEVLIPQLDFSLSESNSNEVYNNPDVKDNYGKDIAIRNKDFAVENGDLQLVGGVENLKQALQNRYTTLIGSRIRLLVYGIQASIGDSISATTALIEASIQQTTIEDPRVDTVETINFYGAGDELTVYVAYVDKNGKQGNYGGTI